jgi:cell division protein FtsI (penicillin-binding protein 3)
MNRDRLRFARRLRFLGTLFSLGLLLVLARSVHLQIFKHRELSNLAAQQYLRDVKIKARRGHVYDRNGKPLAISVDVPSVYANPMEIQDPRELTAKLVELLDVDPHRLYRRLSSEKMFVWVKRHITPELAASVKALGSPAVSITYEVRRYYPNREVAAQVIGFTGLDVQGLEGVEKVFNTYLQGESQMVPTLRDARGTKVLNGALDPEYRSEGGDLHLTIDLQIQHATEQALETALRNTRAKTASAVVLDVRNAELLAVATAPSFNLNKAKAAKAQNRRSRVFTDMFEPGSTFKPLVVGAALQIGAIDKDEEFFCEQGRYTISNHTIKDASPYGHMTLRSIIQKSSNIGVTKIGEKIGKQRLFDALTQLGFGKKTGVRFPGETQGLLRPYKSWSDLGLATVSFGQGVAVSPLQLVSAYRVIASGGLYRKPTLWRSVQFKDGRRELNPMRDERRIWDREVSLEVKGMLEAAVSREGTGWRSQIPGYRVAGKTGTAQKPDPLTGGYSVDKYISVFGGFVPVEKPRVAIVVLIDEPVGEHGGGRIAAPVFGDIALASMQHLGVLPTTEILNSAILRARAASVAGANDEPVTKNETREHIKDTGAQPRFVGLSAREAMEEYASLQGRWGIELKGSGRVVQEMVSPVRNKKSKRTVVLTLKP